MPEWYRRRWLNLLKEDKEQILAKGMIQGKIRNTFRHYRHWHQMQNFCIWM